METFRTYCSIDTYGRLYVLSSTQIVFHARRIIANALGIPKSKVRVAKPRIGGGFGAKQTSVSEIYPAYVTWKTKKSSKIIFTREESQIASSPRHEMEIACTSGRYERRNVRGIDLYTLSNTGCIWRAWSHNGKSFRSQIHSAVRKSGSIPILSAMLCIQIICQRALIVDMAQHRDSLQWNQRSMSWLPS